MAKEFEFDPIKRDKGGKEAEAVIWSSSVLEKAVDAMKKGLPLKANPFIGKNTKLLKPDLVFKRTQEEIEDYMHCMEDPLYFATKCYLMTPTGLQAVILRNYQEDYIRHLQENRFSLFLSCRQSGKTNFFTIKCSFIFPKLLIDNYLKNNRSLIGNILEKYHFYIDKNNNYIVENLPIYELQNLFDNSFIWKLKYNLYKMISWQENQKKKVKNMLNTIKKIFHYGQLNYWYCNPRKYKEDYMNKTTKMTAKEIWKKDEEKKRIAEKFGYHIYYVWEMDYRKDPSSELIKCIKFLQS